MDEFTALAYHRTHGLPAIIARLFNTVGPRQTGTYGMVIPRFVSQALGNEPISVYGDGNQTRTFTYVNDVVEALMALMDHADAPGEVFNIGGTEEVSILALAEKIKDVAHSDSPIEFIPYSEAFGKDFEDMQRRVPGIDKIRRLIGFEPKTELEAILESVIQDQKNRASS
jgi:UDP-glucose 4-epimerase